MLNNPVEELGVDMFGQSVASVGGLNAGEGLDIRLCGRLQLPVAKPLRHVLIGHTNQLAERRQVAIVGLQEEEEKPNGMSAQKRKICSFGFVHKMFQITPLDACDTHE